MAERSKALRSGRSPLLWAWVRIPLLTNFLKISSAISNQTEIYFVANYFKVTYRKQSGAVEACWAHNPEVRRSKLRSAIFSFEITYSF